MSYDISIVYTDSNRMCRVPLAQHPIPDFAKIGEAYLCTPYSFEPAFIRVFGERGLHTLDSMPIKESLDTLDTAISAVENAPEDFDNPWIPDRSKVVSVLQSLKLLAECTLKEHPGKDMMWIIDWPS